MFVPVINFPLSVHIQQILLVRQFFFIHKRNHHPNVLLQQNVISILKLSVIAFDMEFGVLIAMAIQTPSIRQQLSRRLDLSPILPRSH